MVATKHVFGPGESTALVAGGGPSTDDGVSFTNDGRRLDTAEAVIELFEELRRYQPEMDRAS